MKRSRSTLLTGAVAALALSAAPLSMAATTAQAADQRVTAPTPSPPDPSTEPEQVDDIPHPLGERQRALREAAVEQLVTGEAEVETKAGKKVIEVEAADAPDDVRGAAARQRGPRYVQYDVERTANIFTILTDFGDRTMQPQGGEAGPVHDQIEKPDRIWDGGETDDNSTIWRRTFDRQHYLDLMFADDKQSLKHFYDKQSNGRFEATGDVSDWVTVPYNEARYGHNPVEGDGTSEAEGYWAYVQDTVEAWYADQRAQGRTNRQIKQYLAQFDVWDRYDHDDDGDFDEPDGYIDHFQAIHAGEGEEAGGGAQGEDAIWSHRYYAFDNDIGRTGPQGNLNGGVQIGRSGIWVGDYTTEPENGGLGVFAHEFGHDLGLPDLYDTQGGDNGTGFWALMSGGSWLNRGTVDIGSSPGYMGAWSKLQLGWLDFETVQAQRRKQRVDLGPAAKDHRDLPQAVAVTLPDKTITTDYNTPHSGESEWWSGSGDNLSTTLTRTVDLTGAQDAELSAWISHEIEAGYDFLVAEVSTDGQTWEQVGELVDGGDMSWREHTFDLSEHVGGEVQVRFRYQTDGAVTENGAFIDDIAVTVDGSTVLSDDVESGDNGWSADGFTRTSGTTTEVKTHYYLAENRTYDGYDRYLETGPYNFGWSSTRPDWVERFPYQEGMLVWYVDNEWDNNNTSQHPGHGLALPVDARPEPITFRDGSLLGNRRQPFDATFGRQRTDAVTFHRNGQPERVRSSRGIPMFDDKDVNGYWDADNPWGSTKVAGTGTRIKVVATVEDAMVVDIDKR